MASPALDDSEANLRLFDRDGGYWARRAGRRAPPGLGAPPPPPDPPEGPRPPPERQEPPPPPAPLPPNRPLPPSSRTKPPGTNWDGWKTPGGHRAQTPAALLEP
eukprot:9200767-Pyramimonas_sp.AAC.1